ncbi:MAG: hypothetical protein ABS35_20970 [Kaistia sp. SCN 65-12]|jgi:hypothetical protein|nr:MAG: hypothetical protein ABS35_20970 [Kaistia sp. SCN 65-12]
MDAAFIQVEQAPARGIIRDRRGVVIGTIERQQLVGRLIARDARGVIVGVYDERSRTTRDARGQIVARTNLLPALIFGER